MTCEVQKRMETIAPITGFSMAVTGFPGGDPTKEKVREAVMIQLTPVSELEENANIGTCHAFS